MLEPIQKSEPGSVASSSSLSLDDEEDEDEDEEEDEKSSIVMEMKNGCKCNGAQGGGIAGGVSQSCHRSRSRRGRQRMERF
jgi:hypothetical protein